MRCPRCQSANFVWGQACNNCQYETTDAETFVAFSNVQFLMAEVDGWEFLSKSFRKRLIKRYLPRREQLALDLNIHDTMATQDQVHEWRLELGTIEAQLSALDQWQESGWIELVAYRDKQTMLYQRQKALHWLLTHRRPKPVSNQPLPTDLATTTASIRHMAEQLFNEGQLNPDSFQAILADIDVRFLTPPVDVGPDTDRESIAELNPETATAMALETADAPPLAATPVGATDETRSKSEKAKEEPTAEPARKWRPEWQFSWDGFWDVMLSERTLRAILFMAVALLLGGAVSVVVNEWDNFPPFAQASFLGGFTAVFYALGWYVRTRMKLIGSGLALTTVASFLIPLDFYTFYISGSFPPWMDAAYVWLLASIVALLAYVVTTYFVQASQFAYAAGLALMSLTAAGLNQLHVDIVWWVPLLMITAAELVVVSEITRTFAEDSRWRIWEGPTGQMAMAFGLILLAASLSDALAPAGQLPSVDFSIAVTWWVGFGIACWAMFRYRWAVATWAALWTLPITVFLTARWLWPIFGWSLAWQAVPLVATLPFYLWLARRWKAQGDLHKWQWSGQWLKLDVAAPIQNRGQLVLLTAGLVGAAAFGLSLLDPLAAAVTHLLLGMTVILYAYWLDQPRSLWLMSFLLMTSSAGWLGSRGATPESLALTWTLLSVGLIIGGLWLHSRSAGRFSQPLYRSAIAVAGMAIIPPLFLFNRNLLIYSVAHWIVLNSWLALLVERGEWICQRPSAEGEEPLSWWRVIWTDKRFLHWIAALPLPAWLWLTVFESFASPQWPAIGYLAASGGLLALAVRLRRHQTHQPWLMTACLMVVLSIIFGLVEMANNVFDWPAFVIVLAAVFFFAAAAIWRNEFALLAGVLTLPVGWFSFFVWLEPIPEIWIVTGMCLLVPLYIAAGMWIENRLRWPKTFVQPLFAISLLLGNAFFFLTWLGGINGDVGDSLVALGMTCALGLIAAGAALFGWQSNRSIWLYGALWLATLGAGLFVQAFSQGTGRSAVWAALLAVISIGAERFLWNRAVAQLPQKQRHSVTNPWIKLWRLAYMPLLSTGWIVAAGTIFLALVRNIVWLGGGPTRLLWSIVAYAIVTGLLALSAFLYKRTVFSWLAALLFPILVTLIHFRVVAFEWLNIDRALEFVSVSWVLGALLLVGIGLWVARQRHPKVHRVDRFTAAPFVIAHLMVLLALLWGILPTLFVTIAVGTTTISLAIVFYLVSTFVVDRHYLTPKGGWRGRFLYPLVVLLPLLASCLVYEIAPDTGILAYATAWMAFALPALLLGRSLPEDQWPYRWPIYLLAWFTTAVAVVLSVVDVYWLGVFSLAGSGIALLSTLFTRRPVWLYPTTFGIALSGVAFIGFLNWPLFNIGILFVSISALCFMTAVFLQGQFATWGHVLGGLAADGQWGAGGGAPRYAAPLMVSGYIVMAAGLLAALNQTIGILISYGLAAMILISVSVWLNRPGLFHAGIGVSIIAYMAGLSQLQVPPIDLGLALWPGILVIILLARWLESRWRSLPEEDFSRFKQLQHAFSDWWAWSSYVTIVAGIFVSVMFTVVWESSGRAIIVFALGALTFVWFMYRFKLRVWLLMAAVSAQLAIVSFIYYMELAETLPQLATAFLPVTIFTVILAEIIAYALGEGPPITLDDTDENGRWRWRTAGWSRMLYVLLVIDFLFVQLFAMSSPHSGLVSVGHALLLGGLASWWVWSLPAFGALLFVLIGALQWLGWWGALPTTAPMVMATIAFIYGVGGYALTFFGRIPGTLSSRLQMWQRPLVWTGYAVSALAVVRMLMVGQLRVSSWLFRTFFQIRVPQLDDGQLTFVVMVVMVLALTGLHYLTAAFIYQRRRLGYGALLLLMFSWWLWVYLVAQQADLQLFALPVGVYLLGIGWLEMRFGYRDLAKWIDLAGMALLLGSTFWQSFGALGGVYALLMILEGFALVWFGSLRRLRRYLYGGVVGVIAAIVAQLVEPLLALDAAVLLILGAILTVVGIMLERRLDAIRTVSKEFLQRLEQWE